MPLIETKGAASAQGFGLTLSRGPVTYIEDVFSTYLYTGNGSTQTITNGIDLSTKGGLVWIKCRSAAYDHALFDTVRGNRYGLSSDTTNGQTYSAVDSDLTSFNGSGFSLGSGYAWALNNSSQTFASWTFRKQPKFFDIVTYTGNGAQNQVISHNLGSAPGCVIIKRTDTTSDWWVAHIGAPSNIAFAGGALRLNDINAWSSSGNVLFTTGTSTSITLYQGPGATAANISGGTYVAYLFAHNAGGFGLSGTDNVISCGSFTTDGSGNATVNLGYEPQWILTKTSSVANDWELQDSMRGLSYSNNGHLQPNTSNAENAAYVGYTATATGFNAVSRVTSATYIYIAIRRGPMKVPTSGTSVFNPLARSGNSTTTTITSPGFAPDSVWVKSRSDIYGWYDWDKLRGVAAGRLQFNTTGAEPGSSFDIFTAFTNTGYTLGPDTASGQVNTTGSTYINYALARAPGFFDEVCYTGTGSGPLYVPHNLNVVPEFIIIKTRNTSSNWVVGQGPAFYISQLYLDSNIARSSTGLDMSMQTSSNIAVGWSSQLSLNLPTNVNVSGNTYVAYLFATCPGVSKVGSYTGTGALQTINCGFTGGARFVLIKRTDSTGDWYVYDSARGISSGNDPYLLLNSTAAEVTGTNYVDTTSVGFQVTAAAPAGLNANGGTYIFLAIA